MAPSATPLPRQNSELHLPAGDVFARSRSAQPSNRGQMGASQQPQFAGASTPELMGSPNA